MTKIKYRFKGHESFILREGWLNKGMREVRNDPFVFSQNYGADVLGVGPNMAKAIRYWMRTCGLLDERGKQGVFLSKLGEQIWEYDKYLEETFSLWIIHCNIVKNRGQATAWNLFFNEYDEMEFTKDELVKELINKAGNLDGLEKFSEKSVEADGEALLRTLAIFTLLRNSAIRAFIESKEHSRTFPCVYDAFKNYLPSKLWHVMIHLCLVITVHSTYRIKQASQQITFDVIHFSSILPKTAQYILNMRTFQFQKLRFYEIHWILLSRNRHGCLVGNHSLQNQVKDSLYSILLVRIAL